MDRIKLGKITAPVGIRGELRVYPYTDIPERFSQIDGLELDGRYVRLSSVRYMKNMVVIKLEGVDDRSSAETLRNKELFLSRDMLWDVPEDTYFIDDLVGIRVLAEDGSSVGTLERVIKNPAHDLYEIKTEAGKSFLLPAVKEFVKSVDTEGKTMTVKLIEGMADL